MITEDYVSFELAILLKEKGFNWKCHTYFIADNEVAAISIRRDFNSVGVFISAPTLQMVMKWLRKEHKLGIFPSTYTSVKGDDIKHVYGTSIVNLDTFEVLGNSDEDDYIFESDSYEETSEKAIRYCLENLI